MLHDVRHTLVTLRDKFRTASTIIGCRGWVYLASTRRLLVRPNTARLIDLAPIAIMLLSICGLLGLAYGGNDKPTTRPVSAEQVARWVMDLGADDYPTRAAATRSLADAGTAAATALRKAASEADDPERASRALALLARLDGPPSLTEREMLEVFAALSASGIRRLEAAKVVDGGVCELSVQGRDARVVMRCDAKGLVVRAERQGDDAKSHPSELRARDDADLKKRYPEAWEFYRWTTRNMGGDDGAGMRSWFEQFLVRGG